MPLEDKEKILIDISKKVDGAFKTINSLFSITEKQNKITSDQVAKQEEIESESKQIEDEDKKYKIKTTKLLEEIRDKEFTISGGAGGGILGSLLGGFLPGLIGLGASIAGLVSAIKGFKEWWESGKINPFADSKPAAREIVPPVATATATTFAATMKTGQVKSVEQAKTQIGKAITGNSTKTNLEVKVLDAEKGLVEIKPVAEKIPVGERVSAGVKGTGNAIGFSAKSLKSAGRTGLATGAISGATSFFANDDVPFFERLKEAGMDFTKGAALGTAIDVGLTGLSGTAAAMGASRLATLIPIAGQLYGLYELTKTAYNAGTIGQEIAEGGMLTKLQNKLDADKEKANKLLELSKFQENSGAKEESARTAQQAANILEQSSIEFAQFHNIVSTNQKLNQIVDMNKAFGLGRKYSIEDVNSLSIFMQQAKGASDKEKLEYLMKDSVYGPKVSEIVGNVGMSKTLELLKQAPTILEDYNTNSWRNPSEYWAKHEKEIKEEIQKQKSILDAKREKYDMDSPLKYGNRNFANEGIIEGTRRGSRIIAGENYTSEAVVSTKPNTVTETIGKNLYDTIKQNANTDIDSTYRQSAVINDVLKNTIQSYYDITKISPLNTQGNQTIVNNFMGGMGAGNIPETNSHFNSMGLTPNNTETILQKVYMDTYKAALL
jgi:hypothetical protein